MSLAQIFFKKGNFLSTVELDIIITEGAVASSRVTENPVEFGANMNDHIIIEPMAFSISGVVSNVSSNKLEQFAKIPTIFSKNTARSKEAWEALLELMVDKTPFTLIQGLAKYDNIVILSLVENQDKDTANGLFFTATMKEVIYAGAEVVTEEQFEDSAISDKMIPVVSGGLKALSE
ncbi:MAG: hypothetical protein DRH26_11255 [Deltaproteobacteria bacterium]|nr:MAG: hypothetical protein DRH26_11255 [Deltaproteobacteria bacterium]